MARKRASKGKSGDPSKRRPGRAPILGHSHLDYARFPPEAKDRRSQAEYLIDKILHGTPDGHIDPAVSENLRHHLAINPGNPERALLNHLNEQMETAGTPMNAVFPEDLD